ncbi:MAG TPA: Smr/MutS family protein [Paracoccaceae bacterium]|nr:Smr/MutS family protein [Paracoccaceae bacterium]
MTRRRKLHPEDQALWETVARSAKPMHARPPVPDSPRLEDMPARIAPEPAPRPPLPAFRLGEKARATATHDLLPTLSERLAKAPLRMDAGVFGKMTRGKIAPEARIDLHGLTLAEAHPELIRFILNAQSAGLRLVLVITGKGRPGSDDGPIPMRPGLLRHQVPLWLRQPPLGMAVQQVAEAHLRHGGSGALYVYLRRRG